MSLFSERIKKELITDMKQMMSLSIYTPGAALMALDLSKSW